MTFYLAISAIVLYGHSTNSPNVLFGAENSIQERQADRQPALGALYAFEGRYGAVEISSRKGE
jgi:hypothetical protein